MVLQRSNGDSYFCLNTIVLTHRCNYVTSFMQCAAFMEAVNCSSVEDIKDENLREEVQLWLQRFVSLQVVGKNIQKGQ